MASGGRRGRRRAELGGRRLLGDGRRPRAAGRLRPGRRGARLRRASTRRHFSGEREVYLGELVVAPAARRRGVAARLVAGVESWTLSRGLSRVTLDTGAANQPARELYEQLGYAAEQVTLTRGLD